jgi:hypothetical protein
VGVVRLQPSLPASSRCPTGLVETLLGSVAGMGMQKGA